MCQTSVWELESSRSGFKPQFKSFYVLLQVPLLVLFELNRITLQDCLEAGGADGQ